MDLSTMTGTEAVQWIASVGTRVYTPDLAKGIDLGVTDTDLLVRFTRFARGWPEQVTPDDWHLTLAEAYGSSQPVGSKHAIEWARLISVVGTEIAREAFVSDDDEVDAAIIDAYVLHDVLLDNPDLSGTTARALRERGVPSTEWPQWAGIHESLAKGDFSYDEARELTDLGWSHGVIRFLTERDAVGRREWYNAPGYTLMAARAGFKSPSDLEAWRRAIQGKTKANITPEEVELIIKVREQVPTKTRLADYRLMGGVSPARVLELIDKGCTPDLARYIIETKYAKPNGYRTRREAEAMRVVDDAAALAAALQELFADEQARERMAANAQQLLQAGRGALERTMALIEPALPK